MQMLQRPGLFMLALLLAVAGCGPSSPPVSLKLYLENPLVAENLDRIQENDSVLDFQRAWKLLETGDLHAAEKSLTKLKSTREMGRPAAVALAYLSAMQGDRSTAVSRFKDVLAANPGNLSALVGLAQEVEASGESEQALTLYERVLASSPSHPFAQLHRDLVRLQATDRLVRLGTELSAKGETKPAIDAYQKAISLSPDRAALYVELGDLYLRETDYPHAITCLQQALDRAPLQAAPKSHLAEALFLNGNLEEAEVRYKELLSVDPNNSDYKARLRMVQEEIKWKTLPQPFKEIPAARFLTREALAALIAVKLPETTAGSSNAPVDIAIDIGGWSREYTLQVTRAGLMDIFPGHLFAPREVVRRGEAAETAARIIDALRKTHPDIRPLTTTTFTINDVDRMRVRYDEIQLCLRYGLFQLDEKNQFNPTAVMSGEEGVRLVDTLAHLIGR